MSSDNIRYMMLFYTVIFYTNTIKYLVNVTTS